MCAATRLLQPVVLDPDDAEFLAAHVARGELHAALRTALLACAGQPCVQLSLRRDQIDGLVTRLGELQAGSEHTARVADLIESFQRLEA